MGVPFCRPGKFGKLEFGVTLTLRRKGMVKPDSMDESPESIVSTATHSQSRLSGSVSGVRVTRVSQWGQVTGVSPSQWGQLGGGDSSVVRAPDS